MILFRQKVQVRQNPVQYDKKFNYKHRQTKQRQTIKTTVILDQISSGIKLNCLNLKKKLTCLLPRLNGASSLRFETYLNYLLIFFIFKLETCSWSTFFIF